MGHEVVAHITSSPFGKSSPHPVEIHTFLGSVFWWWWGVVHCVQHLFVSSAI